MVSLLCHTNMNTARLVPLFLIGLVTHSSFGQFNGSKPIGARKNCRQPRAMIQPDIDWLMNSVERHNYHRKNHRAEPLQLSLQLSQISQAWANERARGAKGHNPNRCSLGENIYTYGITGAELETLNATEVVDGWYNEKQFYDYSTGKPKSSHPNELIGHFTQVVWKSSSLIGIGATKYTKHEADNQIWEYIVVVANYYPPGNSPEFAKNVLSDSVNLIMNARLACVLILLNLWM